MLTTNRCSLSLDIGKAIRCLISVVVLSLCLVSPVAAKLTGNFELAYTDYSAERDGEKLYDLKSFSQNYSVMYHTSGVIGDQRFGSYNLGLGYEWTSFTTEVGTASSLEDEEFDAASGKVLFRGDMTIAPGALPFRFHLYSYDNKMAAYDSSRTGGILDAPIRFGLHSGEHVVSGVTLMAGIRNGSYLGAYRELLSTIPRLFVDYRQDYQRDLDGLYKRHSLSRDLAFVSLNKKDNWFHYRAKDYTDYNDSTNDTATQSFILGTVDHNLRRQWVNLTNWIKISVDGSLTQETSAENIMRDVDPETYAVNAFVMTDYRKTRFVNYNNYRRTTSSDKINQDFEIPLYGKGWIDPNRSWSVQFNKYAEKEKWFDPALANYLDEEGEYLAARLSVGHQQAIKYETTLEVESDRQERSDASAARIRIEMSKNVSVAGRRRPWMLGFSSLYLNASVAGRDDVVDEIFEEELYGSSHWELSPRDTVELRQTFRYSSAVSQGALTRFVLPRGYARTFDDVNSNDTTEGLFSSETFLSLESRLRPSLTNRVLLTSLVYSGGEADRHHFSLEDRLRYVSNKWRFEMTNGFYLGDDISGLEGITSNELLLDGPRVESNSSNLNYILGHKSSLTYSPNRNIYSDAHFTFNFYDTDYGKVYKTAFREKSGYNIFSLSGTRRALGKIYQEFEYEQYASDHTSASYYKFLFGANYFPQPIYKLGAELVYQGNQPQGTNNLAVSTMASVNFSKLICEVRYSYGYGGIAKDPDVSRKEHLYEAKIKKIF